MGGKPTDPEYWRRWRAAHPTYRSREAERTRQRRLSVPRGDRSAEYRRLNVRRAAQRAAQRLPELAPLFPDLVRGARIAFWEEELAADLRQEAALAELEGRDAGEAVAAYRAREMAWRLVCAPLLEEILA